MSTRSFERLGLEGASRSTVSRRWVSHSLKRIEQLRDRPLGEIGFFGLMIDGVYLAREITVLICIGLRTDGMKVVLDFETGSSESYEIGRELLQRLRDRGLVFQGQPLAVLDGAPALEKAVLEFWPQAHIQRCLVHKGDALSFVISANLHRRHLSESQRAMVAAKIASDRVGGDRKNHSANLPNDRVSQREAAEKLSVSTRSVASAKTVLSLFSVDSDGLGVVETGSCGPATAK
jgi:hypothetical protein